MNLKYIVLEGGDCTDVAQDRNKWWTVVNTIMNLQVS
jgi:hypothetical protein